MLHEGSRLQMIMMVHGGKQAGSLIFCDHWMMNNHQQVPVHPWHTPSVHRSIIILTDTLRCWVSISGLKPAPQRLKLASCIAKNSATTVRYPAPHQNKLYQIILCPASSVALSTASRFYRRDLSLYPSAQSKNAKAWGLESPVRLHHSQQVPSTIPMERES